jgi:uncharacterized protein
MSHQPAHQPVIDGFGFASAGAKQQGIMPVRELTRLSDLLASDAGEVTYRVEGTRDDHGRPGLRVKAQGCLQLRCQRCLEPMPYEINTEQVLVLAQTQEEIDADPVDPTLPDRVLGDKH